jgi:hypothetical protein
MPDHLVPLLISIACALVLYRSLSMLFAGSLDEE